MLTKSEVSRGLIILSPYRSCFCDEDLSLAPKTFRFKKPGFKPNFSDKNNSYNGGQILIDTKEKINYQPLPTLQIML